MDLYNKIYNQFIDLINGKIDKLIITREEMYELDYIKPHKKVVCDNNGNFICSYIDGIYNNYADVLRNTFGDKVEIMIDPCTNDYVFRKCGD